MESVALLDDDVLAAYMETEDVPVEQIHRLLRLATIHGQLQPTFCGSSLNYIGVQPLLDAVANYLPSPLDVPPVKGLNPNPKKQDKGPEVRKPSPDEPVCGLIFKIVADKHADLNFVRVYSGVLKSGSRMLNPRTGKKELINQLWHIQADRREKLETDEVEAGDIVGVIGPKDVVTGDTLCDTHKPILLGKHHLPGNGDLDGGRTGVLRRPQSPRRHPGAIGQAGSHVPGQRQRGNRANHYQRHGGTASRSPQAPHGAGFQFEGQSPQAAGELPRNGQQAGEGRRPIQPAVGGGRRNTPA